MSKQEQYADISQQIRAITQGEPDLIANLSNVSAILFEYLDDINWAGFYIHKEEQLVLGPFQGKAACIRIPIGRGVCGTAASTKEIQLVEDVHQFPGHIACDAASNSEIVLPIIKNDSVVAVLDIDSPSIGRFDSEDQNGLTPVAEYLSELF